MTDLPILDRRSALRLGVGAVGAAALNSITPFSLAAADTSPRFDAASYGVIPDGVTDNAAAINALIQAASSAGGGTVLLPAGRILVNNSVNMASNITLRGQDWSSILVLGKNIEGSGVIQFGPVENITIEDLKIEGNRDRLTAVNNGIYGMVPGGYRNVTIRNVWVHGVDYMGIGILGSQTRATSSENVTILGCTVTDTGGHGIIVQWGVDNCRIEGCTVNGYGQSRIDCPGITAGRFAHDITVLNNSVTGKGSLGASPHGISVDSVYSNAICMDNQVADTVGFGIEVGFVTHGLFARNIVTGGVRTGIMFTSLGAADDRPYASNLDVTVKDNVIEGSKAGGIGFYMGPTTAIQDCPAGGDIEASTDYSASPVTRVVGGRRLYECTSSGRTGEARPPKWGKTNLGEEISDGTSVWTDRGLTNAQILIENNEIRGVGGIGIYLNYVNNVNARSNRIVDCGLSGVYVDYAANIFSLSGNSIQRCNANVDPAHSAIAVKAYTGSPHVASLDQNTFEENRNGNLIATDFASGARIDNGFPPNSSSPSVAFGTDFLTRNTTLTTITHLRDVNSTDERAVVIRIDDDYTVLKHSEIGPETLRLADSADYQAVAGTQVRFTWQRASQQWQEVARQVLPPARRVDGQGASR